MKAAKVLLLPGWLDSGPTHWQSLWQVALGFERVIQHDWQQPLRGDWVTRLEDVVLAQPQDQPLVLAAHSLGCHLVAAWCAVSHSVHRVRGALLVAPPDVSRTDFPAQLHSWRKPVLNALPMPATCVVSSTDPFASLAAGRAMAKAWGAQCSELGPLGHINGESGLADWPQGQALLAALQSVPKSSPQIVRQGDLAAPIRTLV